MSTLVLHTDSVREGSRFVVSPRKDGPGMASLMAFQAMLGWFVLWVSVAQVDVHVFDHTCQRSMN
jgi:hypothetical protein